MKTFLFIWISCQDDVCLYLFFSVMRMVQCVSGMRQECRSNRCTNWAQPTSFRQTATTTTAWHRPGRRNGLLSERSGIYGRSDYYFFTFKTKLKSHHLNTGTVLFYFTLLTVFFHNKGSFSKFLDLSLLFFVFLIHLFLFFSFSIKRQLQSGTWPTLAYGIHTGADSFCSLIKSRLSVWWLKSFADVCWRWSTLLLWMALLHCFCFTVFLFPSL